MGNSYTSLRYHIIFRTSRSIPWITSDIEKEIWSYIGGIAKNNKMSILKIGGNDNHIHALVEIPPSITVSTAVQLLKGVSSRWIHQRFENMQGFAWQNGYGAFTVSKSSVDKVIQYISTQREHHAVHTFDDEFEKLLNMHGMTYNSQSWVETHASA